MSSAPITVLLFEDDEGQAILTKDALVKEGFVVDVCQTGKEGLERLLQTPYQICLVDVQLPDVQGMELLRRITSIQPNALSIVVTGHGDEVLAVEAMKLGAFDYVVKSPYMGHLAALPIVIREGLERSRLKDEREQLQTELWEHARLLEERNAELRRVNEELKRIDQLKSDLVSMVSHELRTPLATIKEFTAILSDQIAGPVTQAQQESLGIIRANIDRLARIIGDLLDMAKIEAGRVILNKGYTEVVAMVDHVVQSLQPLAKSKQLTLDVAIPPLAHGVFADPDKLTQVLLNLIGNAIKFTPPAGRVAIRIEEHQSEIEFSISDTGVGISADDLPKLFEKFQQFRRAAGEGSQGTGLGLAISKRLVELHGGRIWAASQEGKGSTFFFTIPVYDAEDVFRQTLTAGLDQAKRKRGRLSLIIARLRNFEELKALYGMEETSHLLKETETVIRDTVRQRAGDIVIRWQQGEMVLILAEVDKAGAQRIAERVQELIEERTYKLGGRPVKAALAITTVTYPDEGGTERELLQVAEQALGHPDKTRTRILVVDDEPKLQQFMKEILERRDYEVALAGSGPEALEQVKRHKMDLILLDLMMPVMDGYEVYHLLKENPDTKDIPVIIVTAKGERKDRQLGLDSTTYNYVAKPFQTEDLVAKVREVLQQQQQPLKAS